MTKFSFFASLLWLFSISTVVANNPSGNLRIELIAGYNFVVRSNIASQPGTSPRSAYLAAKFCNDGVEPLTNVVAYIGNFDGGMNPAPGIYPLSNPAAHPNLTGPLAGGAFALKHEGGLLGASDASRYIGTIEPGECVAVYWLVSYPLLDVNGNATHGPSVSPNDDLSLEFDVWGSAYELGTEYIADTSRRVFMRNMLQAASNKIQPNTANQVPQEYLDLLGVYTPTWTNSVDDASPGSLFVGSGFWYELGTINQGFDNDGDLVPDYNAWLQPVGEPSRFDPACFRLVKTKVLLVITRSAGQPDLVIIAEDELYFTNLPTDNTGGTGLVIYEFVILRGSCTSQLVAYQAVASGSDNEKFNSDYGVNLGDGLFSVPTSLTIDKVVDQVLSGPGSNLNYTITFTNNGTVAVGQPDLSLPLVVSDSIPMGATYVAGSAATNNLLPAGVAAYTIFYSTNNAATWFIGEPTPADSVTDIQWWLSDPLEVEAHGAVTFEVLIDDPAPPLIYNVAGLTFGNTLPFIEDDAVTRMQGPYQISGTVFEDIGTGEGVYGNGIQDGTEPGISNITVSLYFDVNGDGVLGDGDLLVTTLETDENGDYVFTDLPDGDYLIVVDKQDPDLPQDYGPTSPDSIAVTLDGDDSTGNDFGFALGLLLEKTGPALAEKDGQAVYSIAVSNSLAVTTETLQYTAYATNNVAAFTITQGSPGVWSNAPNALGAPNNAFATKSYNEQDQNLGVGGFMIASSSATITNVQLVVKYEASGTAGWRNNDGFYIRVYTNAVLGATAIFTSEKYLPLSIHGGAGGSAGNGSGILTNDITASLSWDWNRFNPANSNLFVVIETDRTGGGRAVALGIDSIGFIATTDQLLRVLDTIPLYDYYDTNILQFASATPDIASSDLDGPPPNTGRLYWDNVGPLAPKESTNITVTFNVIGPAGSAGGITTNRAAVTNATYSNDDVANQTFAEAVTEIPTTGAIGDTIFWDANRNAQQDASEIGLSGVLVELYTNGTLIASQYTDAEGVYLFANLPPGTYTVVVVQDDGDPVYPLLGAEFTAEPDAGATPCWSEFAIGCDNQTTVVLGSGETFLGADFGYNPPGGSIGGTLWVDFDGDNQIDAGENRLAFIPVMLYSSGVALATNVTDTDGFYQFFGLANGIYSTQVITNDVDFPFPPGLNPTFDRDGMFDNITTNIVISGGTLVSVDGEACTNCSLINDFGYRYTGSNSLSGTVGLDNPQDIDGVLNGTNTSGVAAGEVAFNGVTVFAYLWHDRNTNGAVNSGETVLVAVTTTGANGDYLFTNLPDGFDINPYYIISLSAPIANISLTTGTNSVPNPSFLVVKSENLQGSTLSAYQGVEIESEITNVDFAFLSILQYDFGDLPNSYSTLLTGGARHAVKETPNLFLGAGVSTESNGQPSVGADADDFDDGIEVVGIWQNGTNGATVQVTVGAGSGWLVGFVDFSKSGAFDTANELVISSAVSSTGGPASNGVYTLTFNVPASALPKDSTAFLYSRFRLFPSQPLIPVLSYQGEASNGEVEDYRWVFNAINGTVYWDADADTDFSGGDEPQAGVIIRLYDADSNLVASTVTQLDGSYSFYGLPNGDYRIEMETPDGANAILDADGNGNGNDTIELTLNNSSAAHQNFLLDDRPVIGNISGTVWEDDGFGNPGNGEFEFGAPDVPVQGVLVSLYRDINGDGSIGPNEFIAFILTDIDGGYSFENIPDGDYIIFMTTPNGANSIGDADGGDNGTDLIEATMDEGEDVEDQDFLIDGSTAAAELSGLIWFDASRNGIRENNETNRFDNVTVDLLNASSNVVATTTTAADGTYSFTNIVPGYYTVRFDLSDLIEDFDVANGLAGNDTTRDSDATSVSGVYAFTDQFLLMASQSEEDVDLGLQTLLPTLASIAEVWGEWTGQAEVVWRAESEYHTAAYLVYRVDEDSGEETLLTPDGVGVTPFSGNLVYRVIDPVGVEGAGAVYRLEEIEITGRAVELGVYDIEFSRPERVAARAIKTLAVEETAEFVAMTFSGPATSDCLKVEVPSEGIYAVTLQSIADGMGREVAEIRQLVEASDIGLSTEGAAVAYRVDVEGDRILFFGRPTTNWYGENGVYWIREEPGLLMDVRDAATTAGAESTDVTLRFQERKFPSTYRMQLPDDWYYWEFLLHNATQTISLDLPDYHSGPVHLRVYLEGGTIAPAHPNHRAEISFNDQVVGEVWFNDQESATSSVILPESVMLPGTNTLTIRNVPITGLLHQWFISKSVEVDYHRTIAPTPVALSLPASVENAFSAAAFDEPVVVALTSDGQSVWITGSGAWLPADASWLSDSSDQRYVIVERDAIPALSPVPGLCTAWFMDADNRLDYLVITSRALESAAQELVTYRAGQGLRVGLVLFEEIADVFGQGIRTPEAIREMLRYAQTEWSAAPWMVVLAGGGHADYLNKWSALANHIPSAMWGSPEGVFASDVVLADLSGDNRPDLALGRLPARTAEALLNMIDKIKAYEAQYGEEWHNTVAFAAGLPDGAGDFIASSERMAEAATGTLVSQIYASQLTQAEMQTSLLSHFNAGAGILHFTGHGTAVTLNRTSGNTAVLSATQANALNNARRPLMIALTCLAGRYDDPSREGLGELLLNRIGGGVVAVWSSSGKSYNAPATQLGEAFYAALYQSDMSTLGMAIQRAHQQVEADPIYGDTYLMYNLLGDPAMKLGDIAGNGLGSDRFAQWRWEQFSPEELRDAFVSGAAGDAIGSNNFLEYAMGDTRLEPLLSSSLGSEDVFAPLSVELLNQESAIFLRWNQRRSSTDVAYRISVSTDLVSWYAEPIGLQVVSRMPIPGTAMDQVTARLPFGGERLFVKLDVVRK